MIETFRQIDYSNKDSFVREEDRIKLKEFSKELYFYSSFDSLTNAEFFSGDSLPIVDNSVIENNGFFNQCLFNRGKLTYNKNNFSDLKNEANISFFIKPNFDNGKGYQDFSSTIEFPITIDKEYSFKVLYDGQEYVVTIDALTTDTNTELLNKINTVLLNMVTVEVIAFEVEGRIRLQAMIEGYTLSIASGDSNDLVAVLGTEESKYLNAPSENITIFELSQADDENKIEITHTIDSNILIKMYDKDGELKVDEIIEWNANFNTDWALFDLNFNSTVAQFYIDGKLKGLFITNIERDLIDTELILNATPTDSYRIDELTIYNDNIHEKEYDLPTEQISRFSNDDEYLDIHFGEDFIQTDRLGLVLDCSDDCAFTIKRNNEWFYYLGDEWVTGDGSYSQTNSPVVFSNTFDDFELLDNNYLTIRVYLKSNLVDESYIDYVEIIKEDNENVSNVSYDPMYDKIRARLGAPIAPVELTEEQLNIAIHEAIFWHNYYRNSSEDFITLDLVGNKKDGYEIPEIVGGEENIINIIMRPRFPFSFYSGGDSASLISNIYMQWMFNKGRHSGFRDFIGDYYVTLSAEKDYNNIMGTNQKYYFYNNRVFLSPHPRDVKVSIVFRSAITLNEAFNNQLIFDYSVGRAKIILGELRGTFGGVIPGGSENLNLKAEDHINQGEAIMEKAKTEMIKKQEPLFLIF